MLDAGEVVEVAAVLDRDHRPAGLEGAGLLRDRLGRGHDRVGVARHERGDPALAVLLDPDEPALRALVRVRDERVAQVGDPRDARCALDRRADEMNRRRR